MSCRSISGGLKVEMKQKASDTMDLSKVIPVTIKTTLTN